MSELIGAFQLNPEGDQYDWGHIIREAGGDPNPVAVFPIWEPLPTDFPQFSKVILTGSALTIGEEMQGLDRARTEIVAYNALALTESGTPVLGICYGAQIVANELWSGCIQPTGVWTVGRTLINPKEDHPIIGQRGSLMTISVSYKERLVGIPDQYVIAGSTQEPIMAFQYGNFIGILGHPEMPPKIVDQLIAARRDDPRYPQVNRLRLRESEERDLQPSSIILKRFLNGRENPAS